LKPNPIVELKRTIEEGGDMSLASSSLKRALAAVCFLGLVACEEISVKNGELPEQYAGTVGEYLGVYQGRLDGRPATIELRMLGNKPVVIYRDLRGTDVLHPTCRSRIGDLEAITVGKKDDQPYLKEARFLFDAGECWNFVEGRKITLSFSKNRDFNQVDLALLKEVRWERRCTAYPGYPPVGRPGYPPGHPRYPYPGHVECRHEQFPSYITGRFRR
jgi:hypothetical protein